MFVRTSIVSVLAVFVLLSAVNAHGQSIVSGLDAGGAPEVSVFDLGRTAEQVASFFAYAPTFAGGVRVATGDVTGDGVADIVTGAGSRGGGHVKVFDGNSGATVHSFFAFDPAFQGGVFVAAGDVNGDGTADIIVGADAGGGPHVKVFDGKSLQLLHSFFAYDAAFGGGVSVAAGDVNGDGRADIITGTAAGFTHVKAFSGSSSELLVSFIAYSGFQGGVYVAAGDVNGDGKADIITGAGPGAGPHVKAFDAASNALLASFFAFDGGFIGGVRVAAGDVTGDGIDDIIVAAGPGAGPHVKAFKGDTGLLVHSFLVAAPSFNGGVFVAAGDVTGVPPPTAERLTILTKQVHLAFPHATQLLLNAASQMEAGKVNGACGMLHAFQRRAAAQSGKQLSSAQARHFVMSAQNIASTLECR
jgi:hypothetical protein